MEKLKNSILVMRNHYEWCMKEGRKTDWYDKYQKEIALTNKQKYDKGVSCENKKL